MTDPARSVTAKLIGDFYEIQGDAAKEVAAVLNTAWATRNGVPMVGVMCWSWEGALETLRAAGWIVTMEA